MPGENVYDWSTTAANNGTADSLINWQEGQARATVNNSARSEMAAVAKFRNLITGVITTGGTAAAQTFVSGIGYTAIPNGMRVMLRVGITNTADTTLNMDGIGAVPIKSQRNENLIGGEMLLGAFAELIYSSAVSAWVLITSVPVAAGTITVPPTPGGGGTGNYITPVGVKYLEIEMVGGGGGGGGGNGSGSAGAGTASCWSNTSPAITAPLFSAGGGGPEGGAGGVVTGSVVPYVAFAGARGFLGTQAFTDPPMSGIGGKGAASYFADGGRTGYENGGHAIAKSGAGGGGGGVLSGYGSLSSSYGGSAGAYLRAIIADPVASYYYTVGVGGAGGSPGFAGYGGGNGANGIVIIHERY